MGRCSYVRCPLSHFRNNAYMPVPRQDSKTGACKISEKSTRTLGPRQNAETDLPKPIEKSTHTPGPRQNVEPTPPKPIQKSTHTPGPLQNSETAPPKPIEKSSLPPGLGHNLETNPPKPIEKTAHTPGPRQNVETAPRRPVERITYIPGPRHNLEMVPRKPMEKSSLPPRFRQNFETDPRKLIEKTVNTPGPHQNVETAPRKPIEKIVYIPGPRHSLQTDPRKPIEKSSLPPGLRHNLETGARKPIEKPAHTPGPRHQLETEARKLLSTVVAGHISVKLDWGFEVCEIETGFESRWVHIRNVRPGVTQDELRRLLNPHGEIDSLMFPERVGTQPFTVKAQFSTSGGASKAAAAVNGEILHKWPLFARVAINNSNFKSMELADTEVHIRWESPHRVVYAGYESLKEARLAMEEVSASLQNESVITADLYDGLPAVGAYNVIFRYIPAGMTDEAIKRTLGNTESVMFERPNYQLLDDAKQKIRRKLEDCGQIITFDVSDPPYKDGHVRAWARFSSFPEARAAQDELDRRKFPFLGLTRISVRHVISVSIPLSYSTYSDLREDIGWLRTSWIQQYGPGVWIVERGNLNGYLDGPVFIKLSCEDPGLLGRLKYQFEQLLQGEIVMFEQKPIWDDFLSGPAGFSFVEELHRRYPGVRVVIHKGRGVVTVLGSVGRRLHVKQEIVRKVVELKSQQFWHIPLSGKALHAFLCRDLAELQRNLGPGNSYFNVEKRTLVVRGNQQTFELACKVVQEAHDRRGASASTSTVLCPVCLGDAVLPITLTCRHRWCRDCLIGYLTSAVDNKMFPLRCLGNGGQCTMRIPLGIARELLTASEFDAVAEAAFWSYVHARPNEFCHCPTPDCLQIYRPVLRGADAKGIGTNGDRRNGPNTVPNGKDCVNGKVSVEKNNSGARVGPNTPVHPLSRSQSQTDDADDSSDTGTMLQCPSCLVYICAECRIEYHQGMTCAERDVANDELFSKWRAVHDVKDCPVCRVPIERIAGCNHMTCTQCRSHICWQCLAVFPVGQSIYDHMRYAHGTIGL